jgi:hypothetical protein
LRLCARLRQVHAADCQRHRHVVERGELGQQVMKLVDEAELLVAQPPALHVLRLLLQPAV